jgi:LysM repeat protein
MYVRKLLFALVAAMLVAGQLFSPALAQSTCGDTYTVKSGDNLSKIAAACNVTVADLLKANPEIKDPNVIRSGLVLRLKPSAATPTTNPTSPTSTPAPANAGEYVVQRGDTLSKIATRFGTTVQAILSVNPKITNPAVIYVGQVIKLPSGVADRNVRLTLSTTSPKVNGQVEVKVTGFPANASIDYQVGIEGKAYTLVVDGKTDANGAASVKFNIPSAAKVGEKWVVKVVTTDRVKGTQITSQVMTIAQ